MNDVRAGSGRLSRIARAVLPDCVADCVTDGGTESMTESERDSAMDSVTGPVTDPVADSEARETLARPSPSKGCERVVLHTTTPLLATQLGPHDVDGKREVA
eukprot:5557065-Pleurochrysis_carterae.AAC.6